MGQRDKTKSRKSLNLLTGSGLFLLLVIYFNVRSNNKTTIVDWLVIIYSAAVFIYALIKKIIKRQSE